MYSPALEQADKTAMARSSRPFTPRSGVRAIIAYKFTKAGIEGIGALFVGISAALGLTPGTAGAVRFLHEHISAEWSQWLSTLLAGVEQPNHLRMAATALALDGIWTALEGLCLQRGWRWGPWLVVAATTALLPIEVAGILRHGAQVERLLIFAANLLVAVYLAWYAYRRPLLRSD